MEGITIKDVRVTSDAAAIILTTAFDAGAHGSGAWASVTKATHAKGWIQRIELLDREEGNKKHVVTLAEIKIAVGRMLGDPVGCDYTNANGLGRLVKGMDIDGPLADAIVQVSIFGKVLYG